MKNSEEKRIALYKYTSKFVRAYANIANEMMAAGYSKAETNEIKKEAKYYESVRAEIKLASGDYIDLKVYEPAMRHLIDSYIDAEESKTIAKFENITIVDMIVKGGINDAIKNLPKNIRKKKEAVAEAIENNVRRLIIEEKPTNPKYYDKMSILLDDLIRDRKQSSINYANYLKKIAELAKQVKNIEVTDSYPKEINTNAKRALYDNIDPDKNLTLEIDKAIKRSKQDGWRGNKIKEKKIKFAVREKLEKYGKSSEEETEKVVKLARNQDEY